MPIFDELRDPNFKLQNGQPLEGVRSMLFDFKPQELFEHPPSQRAKLIPEWYRAQAQGS